MNDPDLNRKDPTSDPALNDELEHLRATFQTEWQKALAEGIHAPVIQELDEIPSEDDEEESAPDENETQEEEERAPKKKHSKALFAIPVALLALVAGVFIVYFVATLRYPDLSRFLSAYTNAKFADTDEEKLQYYNTALELNGETDMFRRDILENIAVLKCRTEGYAAAKQFIADSFTEEDLQKGGSGDFETLLNAQERIVPALDGAWDAVQAAYDQGTQIDCEKVCDFLGVPALLYNDFTPGLQQIAAGIEAEKASDGSEEAFETAVSAYTAAYRAFSEKLGVAPQAVLERIILKVSRHGSVVDAVQLMDALMTEDMKAAPRTEEFAAFLDHLKSMREADVDVLSLASKCASDGVFGDKNVAALLPETIAEEDRLSVARIVSDVMSALRAVEDRNLTRAANIETAALLSAETLGLDVKNLAVSLFDLKVKLGDLADAEAIASEYLNDLISTPANAETDEETKAFLERYEVFEQAFNAQKTVNEVFYEFYTAMAYTGEDMDRDAVFTALDGLETADSPKELSSFIRFYKYITLSYTDGKTEDMIAYLEQCRRLMPQHPGVYLASLAGCYRTAGNYAQMTKAANEILAYDLADDYANSVLAFNARRSGDDERALILAESGMDLAGSAEYCAKEAAVAALLREDWVKAYDCISESLTGGTVTREKVEIMKLVCALYDGRDAEFKKKLADAEAEYDALFEQYQLDYSENTQAILEGEKSLEEVFLEEPYTLF